MDALPRCITHRPDTLHLACWAYLGGGPHLACWLDASWATGEDWHEPPIVLVDVEALAMFEVLYGPRDRFTLALAAGTAETTAGMRARDAGKIDAVIQVDSPASRLTLTAVLAEHAAGADLLRTALAAIRPARPTADPHRPRTTRAGLRLVSDVAPASVQEGGR